MNFLEAIEKIKSKLKQNQNETLAQDILNLQLSAGTGGEVLMSICSKLLELKRADSRAYELIKAEADELIDYSKSLNLFPE